MNEKQALLKNACIVSIFFSFFLLLTSTAAVAASVTLRWDPNDSAPEGYRVFARRSDQVYNYSSPSWEGTATTCTGNLEDQTEYYFVVRAYDGSLESPDSVEVHYIPPEPGLDTTPPSWDGATTGIGLASDTATGGSVTVEFDTAWDQVDGRNLRANVYYAVSGSLNDMDWNVVADAIIKSGSIFTYAVTISGLTNNVSYTFGVRAEDQSGNEDANTGTLEATPTAWQSTSMYNLALSAKPDRSGAVYLDDAGVEGNIYVFVWPTTNIQKVEFFIDEVLKQTESTAPYDLAGTANNGLAVPLDTNILTNGHHTFRARITKTNGGSETITADVSVQ